MILPALKGRNKETRMQVTFVAPLQGYHQVNIAGRDLREKLRKGELPDPRIMRPETAKILIERMAGK